MSVSIKDTIEMSDIKNYIIIYYPAFRAARTA
jgi:hypothetical protein